MYDTLGFSNFLYLPQIMQYSFLNLTFLVIENIFVLFYCSSHVRLEKMDLYDLTNFHLLKSINPIQKYPHITKSYGCIL